ncbi:MAG: DUF5050 domain-containing protein [Pyrinomonadaceae bacterium]
MPRSSFFCSLFAADVDGRNERKLLTRARPIRISDNQFSPGGKSIAFAAGQSWSGENDFRLMRVDVRSGAESEISPKTFFNIKSLKWLPGGEQLLFAASENLAEAFKIRRLSVAAGETEVLTKDAANYATVSLNKTADKIIATQVDDNFRLNLSTGGETKILTPARSLAFAPDGKIIYSTDDGDIWTIRRDGGEQRQLTNNSFTNFSPRVSPDNRFIFFASNRTGANQVWRMNADGSSQIQLTKTEGGYPHFVSPDGKWIYYESGLHQTLWKVSADGGEEIQVSDKKIDSPAFSPNGNSDAYFFREQKWKIGVMNLTDKKQIKVLDYADGKSPANEIAWSADNRTLNFITNTGSKNILRSQSLDEDKPHFIADLGDKEIDDFALAPDSDGFAYIRGEWLRGAILINGLK